MKTKKLNAVMTVEMAIIIPLVLFLIMGLILTVFYFHDKNILNGAASETVVTGSAMLREKKELHEEELEELFKERVEGKCIFLVSYKVNAAVSDEEVMIEVTTRKKKFSISVQKKAAITEPEKKIRNIRRLKIKDGKKDND